MRGSFHRNRVDRFIDCWQWKLGENESYLLSGDRRILAKISRESCGHFTFDGESFLTRDDAIHFCERQIELRLLDGRIGVS
jgi:hypothetical protein